MCGLLLYRIVPDVGGKPLYEDEAVAGLISMRPLDEVLETVMLDRGGAPLHFVLTHGAFALDTSAEALRWLSVVCAVAAVPLCFDLGRRLGGQAAGLVAAAVAASSTALAVYGSFGRMYALYVLVAALAADLFVRALELRTRSAVTAAAAAFWLLPAVHPYGLIPALVALAVAAVLWRRRSLRERAARRGGGPRCDSVRARRPPAGAAVGGGDGGSALASPGDAWGELVAAVSAFAGGSGLTLVFFTGLAIVGIAVLASRKPGVAVLAVAFVVPPVLFVSSRRGRSPIFRRGTVLRPAALGGGDRRRRRLAAPLDPGARMVRRRRGRDRARRRLAGQRAQGSARAGLLPTATPADCPSGRRRPALSVRDAVPGRARQRREALALPQGPGDQILRTLEHADEPIRAVHVAVPREEWEVVTIRGPFDKERALQAAADDDRERSASTGARLVVRARGARPARAPATLPRRGR